MHLTFADGPLSGRVAVIDPKDFHRELQVALSRDDEVLVRGTFAASKAARRSEWTTYRLDDEGEWRAVEGTTRYHPSASN